MNLITSILHLILAVTLVLPVSMTPRVSFQQLDDYVQGQIDALNVPGGGYAVVDHGQVVHMATFGVAGTDGRLLSVQTPMMTGSVGKTFTALAIRQLANAGKLDLDAPVKQYLPWFALATPGAADKITVQNLLDHKSGLSTFDGQDLARLYRPGLAPLEVVRGLGDIAVVHRPGETWEYSNLNYIILGVVVEAVSGQPYNDYVQQHIFDPLEMRHSYTSIEPALADGLTQGYRFLFGAAVPFDEPFATAVVPAGFHIASIEDMARYLAAFSNGGNYEGYTLSTLDGSPVFDQPYYNAHWEPLTTVEPGFSPGHSGANRNSNACIEFVAAERIGVVVMLNAYPGQLMDLAASADDITNDVLRMYLGITNLRPRSPSTWQVYRVVDGLLLSILVGLGFHLRGLFTWRGRLAKTARHGLFLARSLFADGLLPLLILLGVPAVMQATNSAAFIKGWPVLVSLLPDIAWSLIAAASVLILCGTLKLAWFWQAKENAKVF